MFAVMKTGGKQYRVSPGQSLLVEKMADEKGVSLEDGSDVFFSQVLCVGNTEGVHIGAPILEGASVKATLVRHVRGEKLIIFKKNRRHNYRRKNGHRQPLSLIKIVDVTLGASDGQDRLKG